MLNILGDVFFQDKVRPKTALAGKRPVIEGWFEFPAADRQSPEVVYSPYIVEDNETRWLIANTRKFARTKSADLLKHKGFAFGKPSARR
jgi:hypothetical protein